jgi:long-chain fatty acid transport protein
VTWDGADFAPLTFGNVYEWETLIGVVTIAPAVAVNIGDHFSIGAALNVNYGFFNIKTHAGSQELSTQYQTIIDLGQQDMSLSGWGYGATFGVLVKPSDKFSIGASFRTPAKIKFSGDATISKFNILGPLFQTNIETDSEIEGEVTFPMWLAAGIAVKPVDNLTLTADVQYTHWSEIDVIEFTFSDQLWMQILGMVDGNKMELHWDNATQIRFGAEYRFSNLALRAGYYIDPSPAPDRTMSVLIPSHKFNAFTFGFGYGKDGLHIDLTGEYLFGKDRSVSLLDLEANMPGDYQLDILAFSASVSFGW